MKKIYKYIFFSMICVLCIVFFTQGVNAVDTCFVESIKIVGTHDFDYEIGDPIPDYKHGLKVVDSCGKEMTDPSLVRIKAFDDYVNYEVEGSYQLSYFAFTFDGLTKQTQVSVHVHEDITAPVISGLNDSYEFEANTHLIKEMFLDGVVADDNVQGDMTDLILVDFSNINVNKLGSYEVTFTVTDNHQNTLTEKRPVSIVDTTAPSITLDESEIIIEVNSNTPNWIDLVTISDFDSDLSIEIDSEEFNLSEIGEYDIIYTVTDDSDNESHAVLNVSVVDTTAPLIEVPDTLIFEVSDHLPVWLDIIKITDNYDADVIPTLSALDLSNVGVYEFTITAKDSSQNQRTKTITVHVIDDVEPVVELSEYQFDVFSRNIDWTEYLKVVDNYDEELELTIIDAFINFDKIGTYPLKVVAKDKASNEVHRIFDIEIKDTTKPILMGVRHTTIKQHDNYDPLNHLRAYDRYDGLLNDKIKISGDYDVDTLGEYKIYVKVEDESGNITESYYYLTVEKRPPLVLYTTIGCAVLLLVGGLGLYKIKFRDKE